MACAFATPNTVSMRVRRALVAANISHAAIVRKTFDALSKPGEPLALQARLGSLQLPVDWRFVDSDREPIGSVD